MSALERWFAAILAGLRHVTLPDSPPDKVEIVRDGARVAVQIEYAGTTVRPAPGVRMRMRWRCCVSLRRSSRRLNR